MERATLSGGLWKNDAGGQGPVGAMRGSREGAVRKETKKSECSQNALIEYRVLL